MSKVSSDVCRYHANCSGHALFFTDPSVTQQSFADECDINLIIARARNGVSISHLNARVAMYGDVSSIPDYRSALDQVTRANGMFMEFDAKIRGRFDNDPAKFLDFISQPANRAECISLGVFLPDKPKAGALQDRGAPAPEPDVKPK